MKGCDRPVVLILLCYALSICTSPSQQQLQCQEDSDNTILDGPHNITVFQGQETMFVCTIPDEPISMEWFINGVDYFDVVNGAHRTSRRNSHNQSNADHILFLPARARLNNSLVQCRYIGEIAILTCGNNATLTIQGPPGAVTDFRVSAYATHVLVMWGAPFTLDVTGVEHDITYSLTISNITNETEPEDFNCTMCHNLTFPLFTFSPPRPQLGQSFNFTVTPMNGAGTGPPSHTLTATLTNLSQDGDFSETSGHTLTPSPTTILPSVVIDVIDSRENPKAAFDYSSGTFYGGVASAILVLFVTTLVTVNILVCYCVRRHKQRSKSSTFEMKQNPLYSFHSQNKRGNFEMQQNPLYNLTTTTDSAIQRPPVYESIAEFPQGGSDANIEMNQNPVYNQGAVATASSDLAGLANEPIQTIPNTAYQSL